MRVIEVIAPQGHVETILSLAESHCCDVWTDAPADDGRQTVHMLVEADQSQQVLDRLQSFLGVENRVRIVISAVEATLPVVEEDESAPDKKEKKSSSSREELLTKVSNNARRSLNFFILVFLSTIVAAVGLIKDNVAVVVGAMVIAPLLGPNLALSLGTALAEKKLMIRAVKTNLAGLALTLVLAVAIGWLWPVSLDSRELLARTDVGLDSVALALASGAAAVLSLTTGLSSVLVGVMVAVALMPPAVTLGLMLSSSQWQLAIGALLLLAVNVVSLNLSANLTFFAQGIGPRTWAAKRQAVYSLVASICFWALLLAALMWFIQFRQP